MLKNYVSFGSTKDFAAAQITITFSEKSNSSQKSMQLQTSDGSWQCASKIYWIGAVYHTVFYFAREKDEKFKIFEKEGETA